MPADSVLPKPEYLEAKEKWEATLAKLEELTNHTQELVRAREVVYDTLVSTSLSEYAAGSNAESSSRYVIFAVILFLAVVMRDR